MRKKVALLFLVLLLAFAPVMSVAAESQGLEEGQQTEEGVDAGTASEVEDNSEPAENEADPAVEEEAEEPTPVEDEADSAQEEGDPSDAVDQQANPDEGTEEEEMEAPVEEEAPVDEEAGTDDGDYAENDDEEGTEEDINLDNLVGGANGTVYYDWNKGYYVLDLQASLGNFSGQNVVQKWVAFALPDGVYIADVEDVPAGVVPVQLYDGHYGVAVKMPDMGGYEHESVFLDIPLVGTIDENYNSPNRNMYLFDIDTENGIVQDLGRIGGENDLDFQATNEEPVFAGEGSVSGSVEYNQEERYYEMELTARINNDTGQEITDEYLGFELPQGVAVLQGSENVAQLDRDGKTILAVHFPTIAEGENEVTTTVRLMGVTDGEVTDNSLTLYRINGSYHIIGEIAGEANIDYSAMNESWFFEGESQIVEDFPGLPDHQFGMRFAFDVQNLTLDNADAVKLEFDVPGEITVHEPDSYVSGDLPDSLRDFLSDDFSGSRGNLDIEWEGNTATINLNTLEGGQWVAGYFTAFGESSHALSELEGLNVTITLYQNGNEVVEEIFVPFSVVPYEGPGEPGEPGDPPGGEPGGGDDNGQRPGDDSDSGKAPGSGDDSSTDDQIQKDKDTDKDRSDNGTDGTDDKDEDTLPKTGTFFGTWFWQVLGALMVIFGGFIYRRSRIA